MSKLYSLIITAFVKQKNLLPKFRYSFFFYASLLLSSLFLLVACAGASSGEPDENDEALIISLGLYTAEQNMPEQDYPVTFDNNNTASLIFPSPLASLPSELRIQYIFLSDGATVTDQNGKTVTGGMSISVTADGDKRSITLIVTAKDGFTTRTYSIFLIPQSSDALIDSLTLEIAGSDRSISFDDTGNASITITASLDSPPSQAMVKNISVSSGATAKQSVNDITAGSMVTINTTGDDRSISLSVTAEDGTIRNYTINITIVNTDSNIDSLAFTIGSTDYPVAFDANNNATITVPAPPNDPPTQATVQNITFSDGATVKQNNTTVNINSIVTINTVW